MQQRFTFPIHILRKYKLNFVISLGGKIPKKEKDWRPPKIILISKYFHRNSGCSPHQDCTTQHAKGEDTKNTTYLPWGIGLDRQKRHLILSPSSNSSQLLLTVPRGKLKWPING